MTAAAAGTRTTATTVIPLMTQLPECHEHIGKHCERVWKMANYKPGHGNCLIKNLLSTMVAGYSLGLITVAVESTNTPTGWMHIIREPGKNGKVYREITEEREGVSAFDNVKKTPYLPME